MAVVYIYGLIDPRTNELRYVGKAKDLVRRLKNHCDEARIRSSTHRTRWIRELLVEGLKPEIILLAECDETQWVAMEYCIIRYFREQGYNLTNSTDGGEGMKYATPELRAKMSASGKRRDLTHLRDVEVQERSRLSRIGLKRTAESRENMSKSHKGFKQSAEQIATKTKTVTLVSPEGEIMTITNLHEFCRTHNLDRRNLNHVLKGRLKSSKGWTVPIE